MAIIPERAMSPLPVVVLEPLEKAAFHKRTCPARGQIDVIDLEHSSVDALSDDRRIGSVDMLAEKVGQMLVGLLPD